MTTRLRKLTFFAIGSFLAIGAFVAIGRTKNGRSLGAELAAARKAGLPVEVDEVPLPRYAPGDDALPLYREATQKSEVELLTVGVWENDPGPIVEKQALALLPKLAPAIRKVRKGAGHKGIGWDRDYGASRFWMDDYSHRNAANLLLLHARAACLRKDKRAALDDVRAINRMARQVRAWPTLDDKMEAVHIERTALKGLRFCLVARCDPREVERLATENPIPDWREGFRTDFVLRLQEIRSGWFGANGNQGEKALDGIYRSAGVLDRAALAYVTAHRKAWERFPKTLTDIATLERELQRWEDETDDPRNFLTWMEGSARRPEATYFGQTWLDYSTDRRLVADAARIWRGLPPKETDPRSGKPFRREKGQLSSPGASRFTYDDSAAPLP